MAGRNDDKRRLIRCDQKDDMKGKRNRHMFYSSSVLSRDVPLSHPPGCAQCLNYGKAVHEPTPGLKVLASRQVEHCRVYPSLVTLV